MKLGIDASRANKNQKTGTEVYAWQLIRELQKIIPPETEALLYAREKLESLLALTASNWKEKILVWPPRFFWTVVRLSYEMLRRPPDLLWIPTHTIPFFAPKTIVTVHDVGFLARPELYKWTDRVYHLFSTWRIIKSAEHIITVSEFSKREIMKYCRVPEEKISVTPLAADEIFYKRPAAEITEVQAKYNINEPYFIFVGTLEEKKNIRGLLSAFAVFIAKHQNAKLMLAGRPGFGWKKAKLLVPWDSVIAPGFVEQNDIPALISGALALILPSYYEGFGIPVLEAFALGTPVIASNSASLPEVGGGAALYFNPDKPEELAAAMGIIYKEPELREKLRAVGLERAKLFSWDKTAEATWNILKRFL
ncbi:glycosyltransferase family 4 protein [Candidatus Uhrbacteria bacterium]|nr:glycosyltransferase family 4 protein [Candidatus Uhrbacteria bacterium]